MSRRLLRHSAAEKLGSASWSRGSAFRGRRCAVRSNVMRELGLAAGVVDVKVCAIDATWSELKLVIRVQDRPQR